MDPDDRLPEPPPLNCMMQGGPVAVFLDFDGTLVELAPTPESIRPDDRLGHKLAALADRFDGRCAVVSGRGIADIESHIGALPVAAAGSHGSDIRLATGETVGDAPVTLPAEIERELRGYAEQNGLNYEAKPHGGALHYRANPGHEKAALTFAQALAAEHGWVTQSGKCVVELVAGKADKGSAVFALMCAIPFAGSRPIFIGDDLTDEKGFSACTQLGGSGILVGERRVDAPNGKALNTNALYQLADVASVHAWLSL